jgi:hypothetical protein
MARQRNPYESTEDIDFGNGTWGPINGDPAPGPGQGPVATPPQDFPVPPGPIGPAPGATPPPFDLDSWYQSQFGRGPDDNERASDTEVIGRYGEDAYKSDFAKRTASNAQAPQGVQLRVPGQQAPQSGGQSDLMGVLKGLFPGGLFNQGIVDRRTELAREDLGRQQKSRTASNRAALANRGLLGDGPEITAANRLETDIADQYSNAVSGIYASESENADQRMMQALGLASNLSMEDARNAVDWFRAQTDRGLGYGRLDLDRMLGTGDLALRNTGMANQYNLDLGRLGLDRDRLLAEIENGNIDQLIQLIQQYLQGSANSSGGYV